MNVNSVKNGASIYKSSDAKDRKALVQEDYSSKLNTKVDKVEISSEAKKLSEISLFFWRELRRLLYGQGIHVSRLVRQCRYPVRAALIARGSTRHH